MKFYKVQIGLLKIQMVFFVLWYKLAVAAYRTIGGVFKFLKWTATGSDTRWFIFYYGTAHVIVLPILVPVLGLYEAILARVRTH